MEIVTEKSKSLQRVFIVSLLVVHFTVMILDLVISSLMLFHQSKCQAIDSGRKDLEYMQSKLDSFSDNLTDVRSLLLREKEVTEYLSYDRTDDLEDIVRRINVSNYIEDIIKTRGYVDSIAFFQKNGAALYVSHSQISQQPPSGASLPLQRSQKFRGMTAASPLTWAGLFYRSELAPNVYVGGERDQVIAFLLPLNNIWNAERQYIISINVPVNSFDFLYSKNSNAGSKVYLYDGNGVCLFSGSANEPVEKMGNDYGKRLVSDTDRTDSFTGRNSDGPTEVVFLKDTKTGWILAEEIPYSVFLNGMVQLQTTVGLTYIVSIIAIALLSYYVTLKIFRNFGVITNLLAEVGRMGDLNKRLPKMEYRELDELSMKFNFMMDQIQGLMQKNKEYEREKRKLEMKILQVQINPHFIFNSLTTIRWMAAMARASNVCQALLALSNALQPVFSSQDITWTIKDELNFTQNYLDIMKFRYGAKLKFVCLLPAQLESVQVLRFLLQPIVENSVIHGLNGSKEGTIRIIVERSDGALRIRVADDGCGIAPDALEQLNRTLAEEKAPDVEKRDHGFALYNINRRIQLNYGARYGLRVKSVFNIGTTVVISIPL